MKGFVKTEYQAPLYERGWGCVFEEKGKKVLDD